jgi:hypothetical protein
MIVLLSPLLCLACAPCATPAVPPDPGRAAELVRDLGHPSFKVRERANKQLTDLGRAAFPALASGLDDPSPEVRRRCQLLLPLAFDLEIKYRLDEFLTNYDAKKDPGLPGWERFRKRVGDSQPTRELFAGMIRADARVMDAVENRPKGQASTALQGRCAVLQSRLNSPDNSIRTSVQLSDVVQALFLASYPDVAGTPQTSATLGQLCYLPIFRQGLARGETGAAVKAILLAWVDRNPEDTNPVYVLINMISTNPSLKDLVAPVVRFAANPKAAPYGRCHALHGLANLANATDLVPKLEPLVTDDTVFATPNWNGTRITTRVGDVALATLIRLTDQSILDYPYAAIKANPGWAASYVWQGFKTDADRTAARAKWKEWKEKQKK